MPHRSPAELKEEMEQKRLNDELRQKLKEEEGKRTRLNDELKALQQKEAARMRDKEVTLEAKILELEKAKLEKPLPGPVAPLVDTLHAELLTERQRKREEESAEIVHRRRIEVMHARRGPPSVISPAGSGISPADSVEMISTSTSMLSSLPMTQPPWQQMMVPHAFGQNMLGQNMQQQQQQQFAMWQQQQQQAQQQHFAMWQQAQMQAQMQPMMQQFPVCGAICNTGNFAIAAVQYLAPPPHYPPPRFGGILPTPTDCLVVYGSIVGAYYGILWRQLYVRVPCHSGILSHRSHVLVYTNPQAI